MPDLGRPDLGEPDLGEPDLDVHSVGSNLAGNRPHSKWARRQRRQRTLLKLEELQPFRLDEGPRSYEPIAQRELA